MKDSHHPSRLIRILRCFVRPSYGEETAAGDGREREQAVIRVVLGGIVILYMLSTVVGEPVSNDALTIVLVAGLFFFAALLLLFAVSIAPGPSPIRRYVGIVLDLSATSVAMAVAGEAGAPLLGIYLWVILGNGFRFGPHYLAIATVASLIGFTAVSLYSSYWRAHPLLSASFLLVLLLIPAYVAALLSKLRAAIRSATEASAAKSQFLAKMSHELRTPLNGVIGMSDLLMDSDLGRQERAFVSTIHSSGKTLLGIIDNILDFSRIEAGRLPVENVEFDVHHLVAEAAAMFAPQARRKGIALTHRFDPRVPFSLRGDALHIRQILLNLLANAIKFTERGSVDLRIMLGEEQLHADRLTIRFEVQDSGIGIPLEEQERIFESFRQASSDTVRHFGGTGLGTAIARELATLMNGRIGLSSSLGSGSLFWVELPLGVVACAPGNRLGALADDYIVVVGKGHQAEVVREMLSAMQVDADLETSLRGVGMRLATALDSGKANLTVLVVEQETDAGLVTELGTAGDSDGPTLRFLLREQVAGERFTQVQPGFDGTLTLPLRRDELENAIHAARSLRALPENVVSLAEYYRRLAPPERRRLHVLVAEDNETNRRVLQAILERAGHRLTIVDNGEDALDLLHQRIGDFDLMLLDKNMAGRSGLDVFRAMRFMYPKAALPTIILSADATSEAIDESKEAGVDAYLTKPVESRRLLETIARLGGGDSATQATGRPRSVSDLQAAVGKALVDDDKLDSLRQLGEGGTFFEELIGGFERDAARAVQEIAEALACPDYPALRAAAHALEGSSREMGAVGLADAAGRFRTLKPFELQTSRAQELLVGVRASLSDTLVQLKAAEPDRRGDQII